MCTAASVKQHRYEPVVEKEEWFDELESFGDCVIPLIDFISLIPPPPSLFIHIYYLFLLLGRGGGRNERYVKQVDDQRSFDSRGLASSRLRSERQESGAGSRLGVDCWGCMSRVLSIGVAALSRSSMCTTSAASVQQNMCSSSDAACV